MTTPNPYLWDEIKVQNFRSKIAENPVAPCLLPCPDRRGLVNGLYALADRLADENDALGDEVERAATDAQIAQERVARLIWFLRTEMRLEPEQIQEILEQEVPDAPGNDK